MADSLLCAPVRWRCICLPQRRTLRYPGARVVTLTAGSRRRRRRCVEVAVQARASSSMSDRGAPYRTVGRRSFGELPRWVHAEPVGRVGVRIVSDPVARGGVLPLLTMVDLPGFGATRADGARADVRGQAEVLVAWIDAISAGPVAVAGNSAGCQVAGAAAVRAPDRISRIGAGGTDGGSVRPDRDGAGVAVGPLLGVRISSAGADHRA